MPDLAMISLAALFLERNHFRGADFGEHFGHHLGACHLRGAQDLLKRILRHVDEADLGEIFDIRATFCMESCDHGPTVRVNGHVLRHATFEMVRDTLAAAAAGKLPAVEVSDGCAHA